MREEETLFDTPFFKLGNVLKTAVSLDVIVNMYVGHLEKGNDNYSTAQCPLRLKDSKDICRGDFKIKPTMDFYYCFNCKNGGDVISFLREVEGWSYHDAVSYLAYEFIADHLGCPSVSAYISRNTLEETIGSLVK